MSLASGRITRSTISATPSAQTSRAFSSTQPVQPSSPPPILPTAQSQTTCGVRSSHARQSCYLDRHISVIIWWWSDRSNRGNRTYWGNRGNGQHRTHRTYWGNRNGRYEWRYRPHGGDGSYGSNRRDGGNWTYWGNRPGGPHFGPGAQFVPNRWYPAYPGTTTTLTASVGKAYWIPFVVNKTVKIKAIGVNVTTFLATSSIRFAIYSDSGTGKPKSLLYTFGTVSAGTPSGNKTISHTMTLAPGLYWLAMVHQASLGTLVVSAWAAGAATRNVIGSTTVSVTSAQAWTATGVTGAFPATAPALAATATGPIIQVQAT